MQQPGDMPGNRSQHGLPSQELEDLYEHAGFHMNPTHECVDIYPTKGSLQTSYLLVTYTPPHPR